MIHASLRTSAQVNVSQSVIRGSLMVMRISRPPQGQVLASNDHYDQMMLKCIDSFFMATRTNHRTSLAVQQLRLCVLRDFPGGTVDKTPSTQCRGPRFDSWSGN